MKFISRPSHPGSTGASPLASPFLAKPSREEKPNFGDLSVDFEPFDEVAGDHGHGANFSFKRQRMQARPPRACSIGTLGIGRFSPCGPSAFKTVASKFAFGNVHLEHEFGEDEREPTGERGIPPCDSERFELFEHESASNEVLLRTIRCLRCGSNLPPGPVIPDKISSTTHQYSCDGMWMSDRMWLCHTSYSVQRPGTALQRPNRVHMHIQI